MIFLLPAAIGFGALGFGLRRARARARARQSVADSTGRIGHGACCRSCALDQAAGRMPIGSTCSPCGSKGHADPLQSDPLPFRRDVVDGAIGRAYRRGATVDEATLAVLESIYPRTSDGRPIPWRSLGPTNAFLRDLARRVRARVMWGFALEALALATQAEASMASQWAQNYGADQ